MPMNSKSSISRFNDESLVSKEEIECLTDVEKSSTASLIYISAGGEMVRSRFGLRIVLFSEAGP
jgi:hypothetical protein